jgi:hypothetical protein
MGSNYVLDYNVDIVLCIDATMSMAPLLDTVKSNALNMYGDIVSRMGEKGKKVKNLRIRIVAFRDYAADGDEAMLVTDFFDMSTQAEDFKACVECIQPQGGGDPPEDGLEALAYAMKSDWCQGTKKRHVIVVWSDDATHALGEFARDLPVYPSGMPKDFNELTKWWGSVQSPGIMDEKAKRLLLFTPNKQWYTNICASWNLVAHYEVKEEKGLEDVSYEQILQAVVNSV